jgi:hypothetical protein
MRSLVRPAVGLVAALVFAGSVVTVLGLAYTLVKEGIASRGDVADWNDRLRHYTDSVMVESNGSWRVDEASSPLLQTAGILMAAVIVAVGSAWVARASTRSTR